VVCSKVCSESIAIISLYGLLLCDFINEKSTSSLRPTKSEKATDFLSQWLSYSSHLKIYINLKS